jgi:hypothetical protein
MGSLVSFVKHRILRLAIYGRLVVVCRGGGGEAREEVVELYHRD